MPDLKKTIGKAGGFATALVGAVATEHLSHEGGPEILGNLGGPVMLVLSHLLTHIGSEFIAPIGEEIIEQFKHKRPNELNHDIQRELIDSMKNAIEGIEILYKDRFPDIPLPKKTKRFLRKFKKDFLEEFSPKHGYTIEEKDLKKIIYSSNLKPENKYLYENDGENKISSLINERLKEELNQANIDENFQLFFLEKFLPLTQFYFGERLKHDKNGAARRAMERMLSEETLIGINKLIKIQETSNSEINNQKLLGKIGKLPKGKIIELKALLNELRDSNKLEIQYSDSLDKRFNELISQYQQLHNEIISIKSHIHAIQRILFIDRRVAIIVVTLCIIVTTTIVVRKNNEPFQIAISLVEEPSLPTLADYPALKIPAKILLLLPDKTETLIVNDNKTAISAKLDHKWLHKKVSIKLENDYWRVSDDSITLGEERLNINIRPTNKLARLEGTVSNIFGKTDDIFISGAEIHIGSDTVLITNKFGEFKVELPSNMLRPVYKVTALAKGFESSTEYYDPISTPLRFMLKPAK